MNNFINVLAELSVENKELTVEEIAQLSAKHQLNESEVEALLERDHKKISELLSARDNVYGILVPAEDDDDSDTDAEEIAA